jgi:hypothetical protein
VMTPWSGSFWDTQELPQQQVMVCAARTVAVRLCAGRLLCGFAVWLCAGRLLCGFARTHTYDVALKTFYWKGSWLVHRGSTAGVHMHTHELVYVRIHILDVALKTFAQLGWE